MKIYNEYKLWLSKAESLGWVHLHDHFVVVDCADSGVCIGEWDSILNKGYINE